MRKPHIPRTRTTAWALYLTASTAQAGICAVAGRRLPRLGPLAALAGVAAVDEAYRRAVDFLFPYSPKYHPKDM